MHLATRMASCTIPVEPSSTQVVQHCLSKNAARGIARTQKQNIESMRIHFSFPRLIELFAMDA
jgi:hypothetical protein